jgi:hypothetical protein
VSAVITIAGCCWPRVAAGVCAAVEETALGGVVSWQMNSRLTTPCARSASGP